MRLNLGKNNHETAILTYNLIENQEKQTKYHHKYIFITKKRNINSIFIGTRDYFEKYFKDHF